MVDLKKQAKVGFNKPLGCSLEVQWDGRAASLEDLKKSAMEDLKANPELAAAGAKVHSIALYAKPGEGKCYYAAQTTKGPVEGVFDMWR